MTLAPIANEPDSYIDDFDGVDFEPEDHGITSIFGDGHGHPGAPIPNNPDYRIPPIDALAFYLPYHYYYPTWWGIYIRLDGIAYLQKEICNRNRSIPAFIAAAAARVFLYYHEAFHHKTECFASRLEVTHRDPFYRHGFESYYRDTRLSKHWLEESLANGTALNEVRQKVSGSFPEVYETLCDIVKQSPPGYAEGINYTGSNFQPGRRQFSEKCQNYCLPHVPMQSPDIWATASHMFDPLANVKSKVNYILHNTSPIAGRIPLDRLLMSPSVLRKKLKKLTGLRRLSERTGRHPMYETDDGKRFPIPDHPGDLKRGTLRGIIKQAGLDMSVREFQNA